VFQLSQRQKAILDREASILKAARPLLLTEGYYALTMDRVASISSLPKGTVYQHFGCKEDLMLPLAIQSVERRSDFLQRGATFKGNARERMAALGEAMGLFVRLHPDDAHIIRMTGGSIREKASARRVNAVIQSARDSVGLVHGILLDAVAEGNLEISGIVSTERIAFSLYSLTEGAFMLMEDGIPQTVFGMKNVPHEFWLGYNFLMDGLGWKPLYCEGDWEETLAQVRRTVFLEEAQALYGEGNWYGDAGTIHPSLTRFWAEPPSQDRNG
jgi:AcrR family transcriptional regulator